MLSVDAVQLSVTVVPDAVPVSCVGAVGGWVSAWHCGGVIGTVVLAWDTLPAASRALTYRPQVDAGDHGQAGGQRRAAHRLHQLAVVVDVVEGDPDVVRRGVPRERHRVAGQVADPRVARHRRRLAVAAAQRQSSTAGWSARCRSRDRPVVLLAVPAPVTSRHRPDWTPTMVPLVLIRHCWLAPPLQPCRSARAAGAVVSWPATSRHIGVVVDPQLTGRGERPRLVGLTVAVVDVDAGAGGPRRCRPRPGTGRWPRRPPSTVPLRRPARRRPRSAASPPPSPPATAAVVVWFAR